MTTEVKPQLPNMPGKKKPNRPGRAGSTQTNVGRFTLAAWAISARVLAQRCDRTAVFDLLGFLHWLGDQNAALIRERHPPLPCKAGCAYCCYVGPDRPDLLAPEVLRIAAFLVNTGRLAQVTSRLAQVVAPGGDGSERAPGRQACLFLDREQCLVYPVRPLRCRAQYSSDVEACRQYHLGQRPTMPLLSELALLYQSLLVGLQLGLREVGLSGVSLALTRAVAVALQEPDTARHWLNREAVFETCQLATDEQRLVARLARQAQQQVQSEKGRMQQLVEQFQNRPGAWTLYSTTGIAPH